MFIIIDEKFEDLRSMSANKVRISFGHFKMQKTLPLLWLDLGKETLHIICTDPQATFCTRYFFFN